MKRRLKGHRERLRNKYIALGADAFTDEELLELLLTLGTPRRDCKAVARAAIERFGNLCGVLQASEKELQAVEGIGPRNILGLRLVHDVARRYLGQRLIQRDYLRSSQEVFEYLYHTMRGLKREVFKVIFLTSQNQIIAVEDLFVGSLNSSSIYPREVIKRALEHHAAAMVFVHNHPSGIPTPSADDRRITRDLMQASALMGIRVLDHLVIGDGTYYSFADKGEIGRCGSLRSAP